MTDLPLLAVEGLETGYGKKQVLYGVSIEVGERDIVAIIGPNGSGKSTLLKCLCGLLPAWHGSIRFSGQLVTSSILSRNGSRAMTYCPQGNRVFGDLTVRENLEIGGFALPRHELGQRMDEVCELFPVLKDRLRKESGTLSGGEQQMLAVARALMPRPRLLMLDEPSLGLAPGTASVVFEKVSQINRETGTAILIVEQKVREVLKISHRVCSVKLGKISFTGTPAQLQDDPAKLRELFL